MAISFPPSSADLNMASTTRISRRPSSPGTSGFVSLDYCQGIIIHLTRLLVALEGTQKLVVAGLAFYAAIRLKGTEFVPPLFTFCAQGVESFRKTGFTMGHDSIRETPGRKSWSHPLRIFQVSSARWWPLHGWVPFPLRSEPH